MNESQYPVKMYFQPEYSIDPDQVIEVGMTRDTFDSWKSHQDQYPYRVEVFDYKRTVVRTCRVTEVFLTKVDALKVLETRLVQKESQMKNLLAMTRRRIGALA